MRVPMTSREDYLKAIFLLSKKEPEVRAMDVAAYLGFSKASVSRATSLLCKEGYLKIENRGLILTEKGRNVAEATYHKYRFFSDQLTALGVTPATAHEDACRLEHAISEESFMILQQAVKEHRCMEKEQGIGEKENDRA